MNNNKYALCWSSIENNKHYWPLSRARAQETSTVDQVSYLNRKIRKNTEIKLCSCSNCVYMSWGLNHSLLSINNYNTEGGIVWYYRNNINLYLLLSKHLFTSFSWVCSFSLFSISFLPFAIVFIDPHSIFLCFNVQRKKTWSCTKLPLLLCITCINTE